MKHKVNTSLLKQVVRVFEDKAHFGLNKVKTRAEVNRTKKKLYKQKGTGGARHGARSAPIFVGGGKAHGPKGVKRLLGLPKKMKKIALLSAISLKFNKKDAQILEKIEKIKKTKDAARLISNLKLNGKILVILAKENKKLVKFFKNIKNLTVLSLENLNAYDVLKFKNVLIDKLAKSQVLK